MKNLELIKVSDLELKLKEVQSAIVNGELDALEVYSVTSVMEKQIKAFNGIAKGYAKDEADKYSSKSFEAFGKTFEIRNGGTLPQYEDDPIYSEMKAKLKEREELLKTALKSSDTIYDSEGLEVPKVSVKYKADSLIVK